MDRFIAGLPIERDGDLILCPDHGVAYQADMTPRVDYGADYFEKCHGYEGTDIAEKLNAGRIAFVAKRFAGRLLDVGVGSGEFVKSRPHTFGHDVNPVAAEWLRQAGRWSDQLDSFGAFTFWDVLEHVPTPEDYLRHCYLHGFVFASVPIMSSVYSIRDSKHYRPGEHLYYFTELGFAQWMARHGFELLEVSNFETKAGRDSILSFAFRRHRWPK